MGSSRLSQSIPTCKAPQTVKGFHTEVINLREVDSVSTEATNNHGQQWVWSTRDDEGQAAFPAGARVQLESLAAGISETKT